MGYVDTVLLPGETVRFRTRRHWVLYVPGLVVGLFGAGCAGWTGWAYATADFGVSVDTVWIVVSAALLGLAAVLLGRAWYRRWTTDIAVTDRRVIYKRGFLHRFTSEMPIERIERIDVDQGLLGQMLDFGNVSMNGIACGLDKSELRRIAAPIRLRSHVTAGEGTARRPHAPLLAEIGSPPLAGVPALAESAPAAPAR